MRCKRRLLKKVSLSSKRQDTGENSLSSPGGILLPIEGRDETIMLIWFLQCEMIQPLIILVVESGFSVTAKTTQLQKLGVLVPSFFSLNQHLPF